MRDIEEENSREHYQFLGTFLRKLSFRPRRKHQAGGVKEDGFRILKQEFQNALALVRKCADPYPLLPAHYQLQAPGGKTLRAKGMSRPGSVLELRDQLGLLCERRTRSSRAQEASCAYLGLAPTTASLNENQIPRAVTKARFHWTRGKIACF